MTTNDKPYDFDRVVRLGLTIAGVLAVVWLLSYLADVLVPFGVAVVLAYLLNPFVVFLNRKLKSRSAAVLITVFGFLVVLVLVAIVLVPIIVSEVGDAMAVLGDPAKKEAILQNARELLSSVRAGDIGARVEEWLTQLDPETARKIAVEVGKQILPQAWTVTTAAVGLLGGLLDALLALTGIIIVLLYLVFILIDFRVFEERWKEMLPPRHREPIVEFVEAFTDALSKYFRGQALVALTVGVLFAIGFSLVGIRMAIVLGLFVGLLNMVPYLQTVGLIPALLLALLRAFENGSGVVTSIVLVLLVFGVVQLIQDAVLVPRIMGKATGLRPWFILLGLFVWGKILGFLGLVLAIPLTVMVQTYYSRFVLKSTSKPPNAK